MSNKIYKMNVAEGIFFAAFDRNICDDGQIRIDEGRMERIWDALAFYGGHGFTIHWKGEVELGAYDHFEGFLTLPAEAVMTVTGVVNGQEELLVPSARGDVNPVELKGKFSAHGQGAVLTDLYFKMESPNPVNVVLVRWLGLLCSKLEAQAEAEVPVWQDAWEQEICHDRVGNLEKNLVLGQEEGELLKEQVAGDEKLKAFFRTRAEEGMAIDCRAIMREYAPIGDYRFVRIKDRGRAVVEGPIQNLAIAGWLLEEPRYSSQAARLILALIAMKWCEGPICDLEGSSFHHVCFREDHLLTEVVLAMGFLGGVYSSGAEKRIADKIEEAWKVIHGKNSEPGYRNFMNQGIVGRRGEMLGALYLQKEKGGFEQVIEDVYRTHTELVNRYLTGEGHCPEGGNYYEYTFTASILLWHTYARYSKKSWKEVVPEVFCRSGRYQEAIMSVNSPTGKRIPINCDSGGDREVSTLLMVFLTLAGGFPEGNNYLTARFEGEEPEQEGNAFDRLFYLYYKGQIRLRPYSRSPREEISLPQSGLLTYRDGGIKLLIAAERNPYTGHFHEDRGMVVLEAEGERLLPDLGITNYANSVHVVMDKQEYHNVACPADLRMQAESEAGRKAAMAAGNPITESLTVEDMAMPEAKVLLHEMTDSGYRFAVETGMLFGDGIQGVRSGEISGNILRLKDSWTFPKEHPLMVTFLSYAPWSLSEDGKTALSGRMTLTVDSRTAFRFEKEEGMVDFDCTPVYILRILTSAAREQQVETAISW